MSTLHELADRQAVADLVHRLGAYLDEARFEDLPALFVDDAVVRTPGGVAEGRTALVAQAARTHRPEDRVQHVITDLLVDLDGDRATVRANLLVHFAVAPHAAPVPEPDVVLGEVYRFGVARTVAGWRFTSVETTPLWMTGSVEALRLGT